MKKFLTVFLLVVLSLCCLGAVACNPDSGDHDTDKDTDADKPKYTQGLKIIVSGNHAVVDGIGKVEEKDIVIPDEYEGVPVTEISGFQSAIGYNSAESVTIPASVTKIGSNVFSGMSLKTAKINGNGLVMGDAAFYNCTSLTTVEMDGVKEIGNVAFKNCTGLETLKIGKGLEETGEQAFYGCTALKNLYLTDLTEWSKVSFHIQYGTPLIYASNLYLNNELVSKLVIPAGVTAISDWMFMTVDNITSVSVPSSVQSIGYDAFRICMKLESVEIAEGTEIINSRAFSGCPKLTSVKLPKSLTKIGNEVFLTCKALTALTYAGTKAEWAQVQLGDDWKEAALITVHCSDGDVTLTAPEA